MKDMTILTGKTIKNKDSGALRKVLSIDEANRKITALPLDIENAEPVVMAVATYDRSWTIAEELAPQDEPGQSPDVPCDHDTKDEGKDKGQGEKPATDDQGQPMEMSRVVGKLEACFDLLNELYFEHALPRPVITVQSTPKFYGHCSTKKVWKADAEGADMYEINIGAEFVNRPMENLAATMCHEMIHLFCTINGINETCQNGRYHNKTFKAEAETRDLVIDYDRANGYTHTTPSEVFIQKLKEKGFDLTVRFARIPPAKKARGEREKAHKYVCPVCGQEVRSTAELDLICGVCNIKMEKEG